MGCNHNPHVSKPGPARWTTRFAPGHGHLVIDPQGKVYGVYHSDGDAQTCRDGQQARADAAAKRIERPCISCGAVFLSEGIHNRMGPCCRNKPGGWDPHNVAPRSGRAK